MPSDPPLRISEVLLESCRKAAVSLVSASAPLVSVYSELTLDEDEETRESAEDRLSALYANAAYDFYGTPSGALCVYKNGDAWPVRTDPNTQRIIREARGVHRHPMQATWREVGKRVYTLLDDKNVRWTSIDPIAFAEAGKPKFSPLLIWIGVKPNSLAYELANTAAEAITFFLTQAGFSGFQIGFRESVVTRSITLTPPKMLSFDHLTDSFFELRKPFTPTLGFSIAPLETPHFEGTGALYLRESKDSDRVFLLTCAHVALPPSTYGDSSHSRDQVVALGRSGYDGALRRIQRTIGDLDFSIRDWQNVLCGLGEPQEGESSHITEKRDDLLDLVKGARKKINDLYKFYSEIAQQWTIPGWRIIGEVVHVEPIDVNGAPHRFTRDWALIELYDEKFDWGKFKGNGVYVGGNLSSLNYCKIMFPWPEDKAKYKYPKGGLLQASGIVQCDQIHNPQQRDTNREQCLLVVKNGLATGTTIGRVTGMESFTRVYKGGNIKETSMEIAVLPYNNANGPFSAPGDSGSIALDRNGRIFGMITGGAGTTDRIDVTYLTPYWCIEEEIKKYFPDSCLYEDVEQPVE